MPPENGETRVPNSAAELPAGGPGRAGMFNTFLDDVDKFGTSSERKKGSATPPPKGNYNLEAEGGEAGEQEEARPKPRKARTNGAKEPAIEEDDDQFDARIDDDEEEEDHQTDDDPDVDDKSSEADDDGEADDEDKPIKSFEEIAEALDLSAEDLAELEFEIRRNGKPIKVSYKELMKGYARQQDLTARFQEAAEEKRKTVAIHHQVADAFKQRVAESAAMLRALHAHMTVSKERMAAYKDNPKAYSASVARNEEAERLFEEGLKAVREIEDARTEAEKAAHDARVLAEFDTFITRNPTYRTRASLKKLGEDMADFLGPRGFSKEEVEDITDHRIIELVIEAMKPAKREKDKKAITAATVRKVAKRALKGKPAPDKASAREQRIRRAAEQVRSGRRGAFANWIDLTGR